MTYNNDWKPTENNMPDTFHPGQPPTDWKPTPQTPEQVDEGLRNAFRQAKKDGVMDATPYLKQMTYKSDIEKTEAEIKVLQKKLELLKEIETHKSQPKMEFGCGGKFEIVSYNFVDYCRYEWNDGSHKWYKRKYVNEGVLMVAITDKETHRLLEGLWFNEVKGGKYD
jgi:methionyl-tRNA formyltransferase